MGCVGPKSVIEVREGMTFLDLSVRQIEVRSLIRCGKEGADENAVRSTSTRTTRSTFPLSS